MDLGKGRKNNLVSHWRSCFDNEGNLQPEVLYYMLRKLDAQMATNKRCNSYIGKQIDLGKLNKGETVK